MPKDKRQLEQLNLSRRALMSNIEVCVYNVYECIYMYIHTSIYIYRERVREKQSQRETERESMGGGFLK